ncbi:MAG: hypothetical protein LUQ01_04625, partial [Methanolinea sp.]|nr:hypothetical protein [Methanolinea sp.]
MAPGSRFSPERLSLREYLTVFIIIIIVVVAGFLATVSFLSIQEELVSQSEKLRSYSEENILEAVELVDTGLRMYDDTLNGQMQDAFTEYMEAYNESGGDLARIDLAALKK